jgi:UDPglucose 6-dehydrogenase
VRIKAYDPQAMENAKAILDDVEYCKDPYDVARGSDALILITEWDEFRSLGLPRIKGLLKQPIVIDGRNVYEPEKMKQLGFVYQGVGR